MRYFKVQAKCGHVKRNNYTLKWFYVFAENGKEAAEVVRNKARVKHDHKDAIREVIGITRDEYKKGRQLMKADMYFNVHNSSDQRLYNCVKDDEIYPEEKMQKYKKQHNGRRLRDEYLEREWKRQLQRGNIYD